MSNKLWSFMQNGRSLQYHSKMPHLEQIVSRYRYLYSASPHTSSESAWRFHSTDSDRTSTTALKSRNVQIVAITSLGNLHDIRRLTFRRKQLLVPANRSTG